MRTSSALLHLNSLNSSPGDTPNNSAETRYSPGRIKGSETAIIAGDPEKKHISTSYVERANLSMRMGMRRFTPG